MLYYSQRCVGTRSHPGMTAPAHRRLFIVCSCFIVLLAWMLMSWIVANAPVCVYYWAYNMEERCID